MSRSKTRRAAMKTVTRTRGVRGSGTARRPYAWLGAGALGVGVWAALASGAGVAHAEGPAADSSGPSSVDRGASATASSGVARRSSRAATSRVAGQGPVASVRASGSYSAAMSSRIGALAVNPFAGVMRGLVGDGTAENPNAGVLAGNGYT